MTIHRKRSIGAAAPFSSVEYNQRIDSARWMKENYYSTPFGGQTSENLYAPKGVTVWVKNDSGENVPMFGVLGLQNVIFNAAQNYWEFKRNFSFIGTYPSSVTHLHKFGIAVQPIPNGQIGKCLIMGVIGVQVEVTDESHAFAIPKTNDVTMLQSAEEEGVPILYKPAGAGTHECVIRVESAGGGDGGAGEFHQLYEFTTLTDLTTGDAFVSANVTSAYVGPKPVTPINVYNTCQCFEAPSGSCGLGAWDAERGRHQIVYMCKPDTAMIQFTLSSVLTLNDASAPATVVNPDGYWNGVPGTGSETVYNTCNIFEGPAGACGVAHWNDLAQRWQIIELDRPEFITFNLDDPLTIDDAFQIASVANPNGYWRGPTGNGSETVWNSCSQWHGEKNSCGVARWHSRLNRYEIVHMERPAFIEFTLSQRLTNQDENAGANVQVAAPPNMGYWQGAPGTGAETVWNTCMMFQGEVGTCGIARWNTASQRYQIIQMDCEALAQNSAQYNSFDPGGISGVQVDPSFSYSTTPVVIPFTNHRINIGDLVTLDAVNHHFTFDRLPRSAVQMTAEFSVNDETGYSQVDETIVNIQYNPISNPGWVDSGLFILIPHVYYRDPPTNYLTGGQGINTFRFSSASIAVGDQIRLTVRTKNVGAGTTMTNPLTARLEIDETGIDVI